MSETQEPARKPQRFWASAGRLVKLMAPHKAALAVVVAAVVAGGGARDGVGALAMWGRGGRRESGNVLREREGSTLSSESRK